MNKTEYLLEVKNLKQYFPINTGLFSTTPLKAVDGVSFEIKPGETLGLVGESGCGKTTVGRSLLRLYKPTGGQVIFEGEEVTDSNMTGLRKKMQMVFQDPYSSLNPRMTIEDIIGEHPDLQSTKQNPINWINNWINNKANQPAPQETEFNNYERNIIDMNVDLSEILIECGYENNNV